ncbi:hypothetical protein Q3G72_030091 [Acer saccharum]|nr:hypothetical protein Q3G72_030091 [Acer saccharum]
MTCTLITKTDTSDIRVHLLHELMYPSKSWLVPEHFRQVSDNWPRFQAWRELMFLEIPEKYNIETPYFAIA